MFSQMEHERQVKELAEKLNQKLKPSPEELREELRLQYEKDRAYEQRVKDEAKAADQLKKGIALQASIRQAQHYIADHQAKVVQWEASVDSMKEQLDDLFADGFRFPEPEAPKAVAEQPKPATPVFPDQSPADPFPGFQRVEHIFCPNDCGHKIPLVSLSIGYQKLLSAY